MSTRNGAAGDGTTLKIERAENHRRDLKAALKQFFESNPYDGAVEDNPETGLREHRIARADPLPPELSLIAGDVIHNARAALDHLVWQLVLANGGKPEERRTAFPVWRSEDAYLSGRPGDAKGISGDALDILYGLRPYKGGDDQLWRLHWLDIVDKHRLLLTVAAAQKNVVLDFGAMTRKQFADRPGMEWVADTPDMPIAINPAEPELIVPGAVVFAAPLGDDQFDDAKITIEVAFRESEATGSITATLDDLVGFVENVIATFEPLLRNEN